MATLADSYTYQLMALLPPGPAWPREPGTVRWQQMAALAESFARVQLRFDQLLQERSPRTALELLPDWERVLGLPDPCIGKPATIALRRQIAHAKWIATGGQSRAYFKQVAAALGYPIETREYRARWHGLRRHGTPFGGAEMQHVVEAVPVTETIHRRRHGQGFHGEPFAVWGNRPLVCMLTRLGPAHKVILYR